LGAARSTEAAIGVPRRSKKRLPGFATQNRKKSSMSDKWAVVRKASEIFGSFEAAAEALIGVVKTSTPTPASVPLAESLSRGVPPLTAFSLDRAIAAERQQAVADGLDAMKLVELGRGNEITPRQQTGLEAIVLLAGRPAILVQSDDFLEPPRKWASLKEVRPKIQAVLKRVGRVNVSGSPNFDWLGTGFLAGPGVVLTNRHVAIEFSRAQGDTWTFRTGMASSVDLRAELGSKDTLEFRVIDIVAIHEQHDLAVLKVDQASGTEPLPDPLPILGTAPSPLNRQVYVVGYPAWDGRRNDPEPMRRIFADVYNVKRLQPGELSAETGAFEVFHDCSTLGGNSGSPVVDVETHHVLGLHFGGRFMQKNRAIPLWALRDDPLIRLAELNY
jgi:hypothetical protein